MLCAHQWNFAVYLLSRPRLRSTNPLLFVLFRRDAAGIRKDEINVCQRTWPADAGSNDLPELRNSSELRYIKTRQFGRPFRSSAFSEESAASFLREKGRLNFNNIAEKWRNLYIYFFLSFWYYWKPIALRQSTLISILIDSILIILGHSGIIHPTTIINRVLELHVRIISDHN